MILPNKIKTNISEDALNEPTSSLALLNRVHRISFRNKYDVNETSSIKGKGIDHVVQTSLAPILKAPFKNFLRCGGIGTCMRFCRPCPGLERNCMKRKMQRWTESLPALKAILSKGTAAW